ncbi:hypothetical protein EBZ39_04425 [bacterium]|nr:hypothetical protein [bacterium]
METYLKNTEIRTSIMNPNSTFILVSYYWGESVINTGSVRGLTYGEQVKRMIADCERLRINYYFVRTLDFEVSGSYQKALSYKPHFITHALDRFPKYKCIFVDTDLQILKFPHLFEVDADCWFLNWNEYDWNCYNPFQLVLPGAVLGFANTHASKTMLKILTDFMHTHSLLAEDKSFSGIITRHFMNVYLRCIWLPETYMYMFESHKYSPETSSYTFVADIDYEMKQNGVYKREDLVMIHEDFETGNLDDVYKKRVGRNRFPPNFNRQQGEKLRCLDVIFKNYKTFGLTPVQAEEYRVDWEHKAKNKVITNSSLDTCNITGGRNVLITQETLSTPFVVVTRTHANDTGIDAFRKEMQRLGMSYAIYKGDPGVSLAMFFREALNLHKTAIRYIPITHLFRKKIPQLFYVKNMDFMTPNMNVMYSLSNCSDPRVLKALPNSVYCFDYNSLVMDFLCIVQSHTRKSHITRNTEYRVFEYVFNITFAVNKMRCYWMGKEYVMGNVFRAFRSRNDLKSQLRNDTRKVSKKVRTLTKKMEQCGLKPPLNIDSDPLPTHNYGSRYGAIFHNRYSARFLEYF